MKNKFLRAVQVHQQVQFVFNSNCIILEIDDPFWIDKFLLPKVSSGKNSATKTCCSKHLKLIVCWKISILFIDSFAISSKTKIYVLNWQHCQVHTYYLNTFHQSQKNPGAIATNILIYIRTVFKMHHIPQTSLKTPSRPFTVKESNSSYIPIVCPCFSLEQKELTAIMCEFLPFLMWNNTRIHM